MGIGVNMDTEHVKFASAGYMDTTIYIYIYQCQYTCQVLATKLWSRGALMGMDGYGCDTRQISNV